MATSQAPAYDDPGGATQQTWRPDGPPAVLRFAPARRRGRVLGMAVGQLVMLEVVAVLAVYAAFQPRQIGGIVGGVAFVLLVGSFTRIRGHWWWEYRARRRRLKARRKARRPLGGDQRLVALRALAPALEVEPFTDRGGTVGIGRDGTGWFAAVAFDGPPPSLDGLAEVLRAGGAPLSAAQLVVHTVPAPSPLLSRQAPAAMSYRELIDPETEALPPLDRAVWMAIRLDAAEGNDAAASRGGGEEGVQRSLAAAARRLAKAGTGTGAKTSVLDPDGLLDALVRSCAMLPGQQEGERPEEGWTVWGADGLVHSCYAVRRWPPVPAGADLLGPLSSNPVSPTSISIVLRPHRLGVEVQALVRVMAHADLAEQAERAVWEAAERVGLSLRRADGEHAPGVYASAPTGGGPR